MKRKTMIHQNSISTYKAVRGNFSRMEKYVIDALLVLGEATDEQIADFHQLPVKSIQPRISELYKRQDCPLVECGTVMREYKYPDGTVKRVPARLSRLRFAETLFE